VTWQIACAILGVGQAATSIGIIVLTSWIRDQAAKNEEARRQNQADCSACLVGNVQNAEIAVGLAEQQATLMRMLTK
jgi:hypothetical protein